jgi:hypothetical protein
MESCSTTIQIDLAPQMCPPKVSSVVSLTFVAHFWAPTGSDPSLVTTSSVATTVPRMRKNATICKRDRHPSRPYAFRNNIDEADRMDNGPAVTRVLTL